MNFPSFVAVYLYGMSDQRFSCIHFTTKQEGRKQQKQNLIKKVKYFLKTYCIFKKDVLFFDCRQNKSGLQKF